MRHTTTKTMRSPAVNGDTEDLNQVDQASGWDPLTPTASPLDAIARAGAREMLQRALESEVQEFLDRHSSRVDAKGRRLVVRNGHLPSRQLLTGVGPLELRQPRVRDKSADASERVTFSSQILPPYLRKTKAIEELILSGGAQNRPGRGA
jgi:transposase-like protein